MDTDLAPITLEDLQRASAEFVETEKRGSFYDMALGLVQAGYEIEGFVLLLATWNFAAFRYAVGDFDIQGLKNVLGDLRSDFKALETLSVQTIDLAEHGVRVAAVFDRLAAIKGVSYTGATKLMHLKCPMTFVMWDDCIRGGKPQKWYSTLPCVASQKWAFHRYDKSGSGYVSFLSDIQNRFRHLQHSNAPKTLAKAIDEFNYVNVTMPLLEMPQKKRTQLRE